MNLHWTYHLMMSSQLGCLKFLLMVAEEVGAEIYAFVDANGSIYDYSIVDGGIEIL